MFNWLFFCIFFLLFFSKIFSVISFLDPFFGVLKNNLLQVKQNQKWQNHGGFAKGLLEKIHVHSLF